MITSNRVFCEECKKEIEALSEEDASADIIGHGWSDFKTAQKHLCEPCVERIRKECGYRESIVIYHIPYETYIAELKVRRIGKGQRYLADVRDVVA